MVQPIAPRRCPGCGASPIAGFACVECWPDLPGEFRRRIVRVTQQLRGDKAERERAARAARQWFDANPLEVRRANRRT